MILSRDLPFLFLAGMVVSSCDRADESGAASGSVAESSIEIATPADPPPAVEVVFSEPEVEEEKRPALPPVVYRPGDSFQGMWNYDRRNFNLRLTIIDVDPENRTVTATMQSEDLDDEKKTFRSTAGKGGRELSLTGVAGTGSDYPVVSGYHLSQLLDRDTEMNVELTDCYARQLRGTVENGTNLYFWTRVRPKGE